MPTSDETRRLAAQVMQVVNERGAWQDAASGLPYYSGYNGELYDWELYFDALLLSIVGKPELAWNNVRLMLGAQKANGFIPRHFRGPNLAGRDPYQSFEDEEHCKPFLSQAALLLARVRGDASFLSLEELGRLRGYIDHWLLAWDADGNGLSEWSSAPHSGCDTQFERMGYWRARFCEGVDLNCYLYRECLAAAHLADALQQPGDAAYLRHQAARKRERCQAVFWDERDGFFYDRDVRTGSPIRVKTTAGFMPLWAGIATPAQARRLVREHLTNPAEFWTPYPLPAYARSEPRYSQFYQPQPGASALYALGPGHCTWNGGLWPHHEYLVAHGLQAHGYAAEAAHIAGRFLEVIAADPKMHEWYDAETGKGMGMTPFCAGATVLGAFLQTELALGLDLTGITAIAAPLPLDRLRAALGVA